MDGICAWKNEGKSKIKKSGVLQVPFALDIAPGATITPRPCQWEVKIILDDFMGDISQGMGRERKPCVPNTLLLITCKVDGGCGCKSEDAILQGERFEHIFVQAPWNGQVEWLSGCVAVLKWGRISGNSVSVCSVGQRWVSDQWQMNRPCAALPIACWARLGSEIMPTLTFL